MPSLRELADTVSSFRYYSGTGNFTGRNVPYGDQKPLYTTDAGFRWSPSNFDEGLVPFGAVTRATRSTADLFRIGKWLTTDPRGPLFVLKQASLQLANPSIEFPRENISKVGPTRQYSPIPLFSQLVGNAVGARFPRHGLFTQQSDTTAYEKYVLRKDKESGGVNNRLITLYKKLSDPNSKESKESIVLSYTGGPGSFYGIGRTTIHRYGNILSSQNSVSIENNSIDLEKLLRTASNKNSNETVSKFLYQYKTSGSAEIRYRKRDYTGTTIAADSENKLIPVANYVSAVKRSQGQTDFTINPFVSSSTVYTLQQNFDFRKYKNAIYSVAGGTIGGTLPTGSYETQNLKTRIGISQPRTAAQKSGGVVSEKQNAGTHDYVNYLSLYSSTTPKPIDGTRDINENIVEYNPSATSEASIRDLIKFRIKIIDNDSAPNGTYIVFRAYISSIKRSTAAKWDSYSYVGRGENFYAYNGFSETISIAFTIAASSRREMKPLYQKLNYLISSLAPDYGPDGKMRGNISELTIGNFVLYQPGVITNLDMTIDEDSNWEIAIDEYEDGNDNDMHELPQLIKCTMTFLPIYNFLPRKGFKSPFIGIDYFPGVKPNQRWLYSDEQKGSDL